MSDRVRPEEFALRLDDALSDERHRAFRTGATIRLVGSSVFLLLAMLFSRLAGLRDWAVYVPVLAAYCVAALGLFAFRNHRRASGLAWVTAGVDVLAVYALQRLAIPVSPTPAGVAGFSLGLFVLLLVMNGPSLRNRGLWAMAAGATAAETLLMRQAGVDAAAWIAGALVLALAAAVLERATLRLGRLALEVAQEEVARRLEVRRLIELEVARQNLKERLADAQARYQELSQEQKDRASILQLVVHDLRSPLTAIMTSLESMTTALKGRPAASEMQEMLAEAIEAANRLATLVAEVLDTARLEEGRWQIARTTISATDLFERVRRGMAPRLRVQSVELVIDVGYAPPLSVDQRLFVRVLENLVSNAIRFTPAGGQILLAAALETAAVRVSVHNNGTPIAPDSRDRLFDKYLRAGGGTHADAGWGLGLYFCRLAVEAHGGSIVVEDLPPWNTTFSIRLPLAT